MEVCRVCQNVSVEILLNLGLHPVSNRFLEESDIEEFKHPFILGCCQSCGLVQLIKPVDSDNLVPRYAWIKYNEPEAHLDDLANVICSLPGITKNSIFLGLSCHETSLLKRLHVRDFLNTCQLEKQKDFNIQDPFSGIESIQKAMTVSQSSEIVRKRGKANVVIARSILEHAQSPLELIRAIHNMLQPNGYVIFEVPESTRAFELGDYSMLWEEHVFYFTPYTLQRCIEQAGFECYLLKVYRSPTLDSMVMIVREAVQQKKLVSIKRTELGLSTELHRSLVYQNLYPKQVERCRKSLITYAKKGAVALLGAGHLACRFLNIMQVGDLINFVLDDHPEKKGMFFPGTKHPILSTDILDSGEISLCLLSLSSSSEHKIMTSKLGFTDRGGEFFSIFPTSNFALPT